MTAARQSRHGQPGSDLQPDYTAARAYLELDREGLLSKKRGTGTYVSSQAARLGDKARIVRELLEKALVQAMQSSGVTAC